MALINPDIPGYMKMVNTLFHRYSKDLASVQTEWRVLLDSDNEPIAVFPCLMAEMKKGSDVIADLQKHADTTYAGAIYVDGELVVDNVS
jgi:hypothetical protein